MPGWPTVDRADDHQLVDALRRADTDAPAKLYDAYAERLHDYACSLTGDRDQAADAVHDALVTAQGCVDQLKETTRLRAWLYALTRFQAAARLDRGQAQDPTPPPVLDDPEDPEMAELVHEALGELSRSEREVLELSLRHGLTPGEAGSVLGLTSRQATTRLGRARDHLENAAAAVVLARTGRAHCPDLSAMVDSWEGPLTPMLRRRLSGHISGCEVCTEGRHKHVAAARLLDMVPVAFPPISLRRRVVETCVNPELDQTRTMIADTGAFDKTGFPVADKSANRPSKRPRAGARRRRPRKLLPVVLLAVTAMAATGAMALMGGEEKPLALSVPPPTASSDPLPSTDQEPELQTEESEEPPTPTPTVTRTTPTASTPTRRAAPTTQTTRPAANPTTTRAPQPVARLAVGCPGRIDGAGKVTLSARNATVTWSATSSEGLDVFPASGSLRSGASVAIWVTAIDPDEPGSGTVVLTSNGGGGSCSVTWRGDPPQSSESPTAPPNSPDPTVNPDATATSSTTTDQTAATADLLGH
ncbi:RNA polymerase sigma factor [Nonomuraea sp. NPDC050556]|uniref:RNA polymerase sigma factor n=1 Tax=Nonomuraea sp. NPDC050556 TaxID=3364369 RepID=UPI0037A81677